MPNKVITHAINIAPAPAPSAIFCGRLKIPLPTILPTTIKVRGSIPSFFLTGVFILISYLIIYIINCFFLIKISMTYNLHRRQFYGIPMYQLQSLGNPALRF